jgi:hypothetical protein
MASLAASLGSSCASASNCCCRRAACCSLFLTARCLLPCQLLLKLRSFCFFRFREVRWVERRRHHEPGRVGIGRCEPQDLRWRATVHASPQDPLDHVSLASGSESSIGDQKIRFSQKCRTEPSLQTPEKPPAINHFTNPLDCLRAWIHCYAPLRGDHDRATRLGPLPRGDGNSHHGASLRSAALSRSRNWTPHS